MPGQRTEAYRTGTTSGVSSMSVKGVYPESACKRFRVKDSIGVPHPYCLTPKHVAWASDHCCGMLDESAIKEAEEHGARCDICKGELSYEQHEIALAVECDAEDKPALGAYLKSIVDEATANKYAGFVLVKNWKD